MLFVDTVVEEERGYPSRYWDWAMAWTFRGSNVEMTGVGTRSRLQNAQTGSKTHPAPRWVPGFFPGGWNYQGVKVITPSSVEFNPLNAELNPICPLLALFGTRYILYFSR